MKKVLMVTFAMVMALTLVFGSISTVSARPAAPNDTGLCRFSIDYFFVEGNRYFFDIMALYDNSIWTDSANIEVADPGPFGYFIYPTENNELYCLNYYGEITPDINWGKGVGTIQSDKFDLTVTFDPKGATRYTDATSGRTGIFYSGEVNFSGTVTVNCGDNYTIPSTSVSANLLEEHTFPKP